ncbi:MAG: 30S ribosomal protein S6 [Patescibacteria group bacterium]
METYEITYIVDSADKARAVRDVIAQAGANYKETKDWGERDLAYPIAKNTKGFYFTGHIKTIPTNITEIKKKLNYSNVAIRYIILRVENA